MFGIKLYEKYNKVKPVFQKPILKFWCGKYKQMPGLPLFRRKPQIKLFKKYQSKNLDNKDANVYIFDPKVWIEKDGKLIPKIKVSRARRDSRKANWKISTHL